MSENSTQKRSDYGAIHSVYKPVSMALAAAAGLGTTAFLINDEAYANLKKHGALDDILDVHYRDSKAAATKANSLIGDVSEHGFFRRFISKEQSTVHDKIAARMKNLGIGSTAEQWQSIHSKQRFTSAVWGLTVTGVMLGAAMEIGREMERAHDRKAQGR